MSEFHEHVPNVKNFQFLEKNDQNFRKIQQNEYLVAIVAVDTAENEPRKVWGDLFNYSVVSLVVSLFRRTERGSRMCN
jgi:hypothetical protein